MDRRAFLTSLGLAAAGSQLACASVAQNVASGRRLRRVGIQLYTLRDDARRDLERTLADIAGAGYKDVELLSSMNNFGMPPARLRQVLDQNGLRAPSTHVGAGELNDLDRQLADAATLGHKYIVLASLPGNERTLDDYKRWADRLNDLGRRSQTHGVWIGFHNEAYDFPPIGGVVPYDVLVERTDPALVRLQLDTGNMAMGGRDPLEYMKRIGKRYWLFHIKDAPGLGASTDAELGKGVVDFKSILASIDDIDDKLLYVEQETYPGAPLDSARRDYAYIMGLTF
jgi:sugar phosphate isomerase/epimerase